MYKFLPFSVALSFLAMAGTASAYSHTSVRFKVDAVTTSVPSGFVGIRVAGNEVSSACAVGASPRFRLLLSDPAADSFRDIMLAAFLSGSEVEISWDNDECVEGKAKPLFFKVVGN